MVVLLKHALEGGDGRTTLILKGHLALEQTLEAAAAKRLKNPHAILGNQTKFATKLSLVKALYGVDLDNSLYTLCNKLNTLRNQLAHDLQAKSVPKLINDILNLADPGMPGKGRKELEFLDSDSLDELLYYKIAAVLEGICEVAFAEEIANHNEEMTEWLAKLPKNPARP